MGSIDNKELNAEVEFDDGWLDYWICTTGCDFYRRLELRDGKLVVSVVTLFVVLGLPQGFF